MAPITGHIMISYKWDDQSEVKKIAEALKENNFNVWIDYELVHGDIQEQMAEAVEGAALVIVCISAKYQESENCKKEFTYADQQKKNIIPIIMEKGFNASGKLALITAGKKYIDYSNSSMFDENMKTLKGEIDFYMESTSMYDFLLSFALLKEPFIYTCLHYP